MGDYNEAEELKQKLYYYIDIYGLCDYRTVEVSQALDAPIVKLQGDLNAKN